MLLLKGALLLCLLAIATSQPIVYTVTESGRLLLPRGEVAGDSEGEEWSWAPKLQFYAGNTYHFVVEEYPSVHFQLTLDPPVPAHLSSFDRLPRMLRSVVNNGNVNGKVVEWNPTEEDVGTTFYYSCDQFPMLNSTISVRMPRFVGNVLDRDQMPVFTVNVVPSSVASWSFNNQGSNPELLFVTGTQYLFTFDGMPHGFSFELVSDDGQEIISSSRMGERRWEPLEDHVGRTYYYRSKEFPAMNGIAHVRDGQLEYEITHSEGAFYSFNGLGPNPTLWLTAGLHYTFIIRDYEELPFQIIDGGEGKFRYSHSVGEVLKWTPREGTYKYGNAARDVTGVIKVGPHSIFAASPTPALLPVNDDDIPTPGDIKR
eukprot:TRINITY_DN9177_c0_g1_i1.p1 TRINITY_DN9177_c0_g1~~TRINITY_DN9177_c0_g1_i1.p1  ORF type:complete len:371 (+),score=43.83 TRINITY_DN9177_c0_g1_i1:1305-2417(+)